MTRKEMITKCVDYQITTGIIKKESRTAQINARLNGFNWGMVKPMKKAECEAWYNEICKVAGVESL